MFRREGRLKPFFRSGGLAETTMVSERAERRRIPELDDVRAELFSLSLSLCRFEGCWRVVLTSLYYNSRRTDISFVHSSVQLFPLSSKVRSISLDASCSLPTLPLLLLIYLHLFCVQLQRVFRCSRCRWEVSEKDGFEPPVADHPGFVVFSIRLVESPR